jgi:pectate lyase
VINNVVYNGREGFVHHNPAIGDFNIVGNFYKDGPSASLAPFWFDPENSPPIPTRYYVWDNWVDDPGNFVGRVDNPYTTPGFAGEYSFACCGILSSQFNNWGRFDFTGYLGYEPITTTGPALALSDVLAKVGAWPRDIVNHWAVDQTTARNGSWGNHRPANWLEGLTPGTPPTDADNDGMADSWELTHGLNPANGADHATVRPSGYTAIEEYVNELADILVGGSVALFADGFESGSTNVWSQELP